MIELIANPEFFETIDRYEPGKEFIDVVNELLPTDWTSHRNGVWLGYNPPDNERNELPTQGWKIHVSSAGSSAADVLKTVVPILEKEKISFKFALDGLILSLMNGKAWGRQGAGKFITIYPTNDDNFRYLIEILYQATKQYKGLYILSDKRYKDSKVIFYRYGGIRPFTYLNEKGDSVSYLNTPTGDTILDVRAPYFHLPDWLKDPFESDQEVKEEFDSENITLKDGRYVVKHPLGYSNTGGIYVAEDTTTGTTVVIKEARPFHSETVDPIALLEKEYRLLSKVAHTGLVPKPIDHFQDWEHSFLVLEQLKGTTLATFSSGNNITLLTHPPLKKAKKFYSDFKDIFIQVANIVKVMHQNGVIITDFSPNNLIIDPETNVIKILDFEGAYEIGVDTPIYMFTPGFVAPDQFAGANSDYQSDYFALGATMHYFLAPVNQIFLINPKARYAFVNSVVKDIGFPESISKIIGELIDKSPEKRPAPDKVIRILEEETKIRKPNFDSKITEVETELKSYINEIPDYIIAKADYERKERLFPSHYNLFGTNPLSLVYGAAGTAYAVNKMKKSIPEAILSWIIERNKHPDLYPPGLYMGLSGIAWAMLEIGLEKESQEVIKSTFDHSLLHKSADIYYGTAGWGLANLKFFTAFQDECYLQNALAAGQHLLNSVKKSDEGWYWSSTDEIPLGFAHGGSGISQFLLYLYLANKKEEFLDAGIRALDFEINNSSKNLEDGVSWRRIAKTGSIVYPYWQYGSSGVGMAVIRYFRLLGDKKYSDLLEKIYIDTNRKYAVYPGVINGLSGLGEFLLDLFEVTKKEHHLKAAYRIASGISLFKIQREDGIAFPGEGLRRISCDYGNGSAGVGLFLHRLINKEKGNFNVDVLFDK